MSLLLGICIGALIIPYLMAGEIYDYQDTFDGVHLPPVDAIVCLAGGRGRIVAAGDLWVQYHEAHLAHTEAPAPVLYVSGVGPRSSWASFLKRLRSGVRDVIQPPDVVLERESSNTETNALWYARYARERGWKRLLLITSPYHMRRAEMIFRSVLSLSGRPFKIDTLSIYQEPFDATEWRGSPHGVYVTMFEYIKWIYYRYFWHPKPGAEEWSPIPAGPVGAPPAKPMLMDPAPAKPGVIRIGS